MDGGWRGAPRAFRFTICRLPDGASLPHPGPAGLVDARICAGARSDIGARRVVLAGGQWHSSPGRRDRFPPHDGLDDALSDRAVAGAGVGILFRICRPPCGGSSRAGTPPSIGTTHRVDSHLPFAGSHFDPGPVIYHGRAELLDLAGGPDD